MPSSNTFYARSRGYSGIIQLRSGRKNFKTRTGTTVDSELERRKSGKNPASPSNQNDGHWMDNSTEDKRKNRIL